MMSTNFLASSVSTASSVRRIDTPQPEQPFRTGTPERGTQQRTPSECEPKAMTSCRS